MGSPRRDNQSYSFSVSSKREAISVSNGCHLGVGFLAIAGTYGGHSFSLTWSSGSKNPSFTSRNPAGSQNPMKTKISTLTLFFGILMAAAAAEARPFRVNQLPSAPGGCDTCHTMGGGSPTNVFGRDVFQTLSGSPISSAAVNWPALCVLDSDGDGASNGAELGDAACTWRVGQSSRTALADPADPASVPGGGADAGFRDALTGGDTGVSGGTDAGMRSTSEFDDEGGCSATGANASVPLWAVAIVGWAWMRRRLNSAG